jgi:hypothetical protein
VSERESDPRKRPPDPAGTQPKVDPESLRATAPLANPGLPAAEQRPALLAGADGLAVEAPAQSASPTPHTASQLPARPTPSRGANQNAPRFQFLFGALGALSVAAIALAVVLLRAPAPTPEAPWSAWKPVENEVDPAVQIADYVAPQYRLDNGKQIVQVTGGPPAFKGAPLLVGITRSGKAAAALEGNNVLYQLCGGGVNCSIAQGKPSTQRGLLIGREALELALYTFRYVPGVDRVLVTIPPPPPGSTKAPKASPSTTGKASLTSSTSLGNTSTLTASHALLFDEQDLAPALERPLSATLSPVTPLVSQMERWPDAAAVKALTEPHVYDFTISETQTGAVMLLEPPGFDG